ncbi:MAG: hypothetical protein IV092_09790 [Burkholderiaceae bacterium]|nr:hypothetical protein [Burkholderiaceae bacterium]
MQARIWLSGRCFECRVERIEPSADAWIVKTRARRYFRFDTATIGLLRQLMSDEAPDLEHPEQASAMSFVQGHLIPLGIIAPVGEAAEAPSGHASTGAMRWQRAMHSVELIGYRDLLTYAPQELALLVAVAVGRGLLHELGHAAACRRHTGSVGAIGFGIFMTTPVLYCDVSDIHLLPRRAKAMVGLAGGDIGVMKVFWLSLVAIAFNLVPFYRNDGFWVLNDLAGTDDLLKQSLAACRAGKARLRDWALLAFMAGCVGAMVVPGWMFATEAGPQQVADIARLMPSFPGVVLALVFGLRSAVKLLMRRK